LLGSPLWWSLSWSAFGQFAPVVGAAAGVKV
jgi:hypothetical protein